MLLELKLLRLKLEYETLRLIPGILRSADQTPRILKLGTRIIPDLVDEITAPERAEIISSLRQGVFSGLNPETFAGYITCEKNLSILQDLENLGDLLRLIAETCPSGREGIVLEEFQDKINEDPYLVQNSIITILTENEVLEPGYVIKPNEIVLLENNCNKHYIISGKKDFSLR
jgi:hypothetical protein